MLLDQLSSMQNLKKALDHCRRGKKMSIGYQNFILNLPTSLQNMQKELRTNSYQMGSYRAFEVRDPKKRVILAAPFKDRIVHQALCQIIGQSIDDEIPQNSFACRVGLGNRKAVLKLLESLKKHGEKRYVIKLDIERYFAGIDHQLLKHKLDAILADQSLSKLINDLLLSHETYPNSAKGIPLGNVSSQYFANLYLSDIDKLAMNHDIDYFRYMDDMLICGRTRELALFFTKKALNIIENSLKLECPPRKRVFLANGPVPFLGFVVDHCSYRPLRRNERRFDKKLKRLIQSNAKASTKAQLRCAFEAWKNL